MLSLVEIGPVVLEQKIFKFRQCVSDISKLSPIGRGRTLYFKNLEFPSTKDALCQVRLKLAQCFWRRRFLNFVNVFHFPLEKGVVLRLNKLEFPT